MTKATSVLCIHFFIFALAGIYQNRATTLFANADVDAATSNRGLYGIRQGFGPNPAGIGPVIPWNDPWSNWARSFLSNDDSPWSRIIPGFNIKEYDDEYIAFVECPGYKQKEINVSLEDNNRLKIKAKKECKENDRLCVPRNLLEEFQVSEAVNADKISVYLEDGVLHLHLPKAKTKSSQLFFNIQLPSIFGGTGKDTGDRIPVSHHEYQDRQGDERSQGAYNFATDYAEYLKSTATEGMKKMYETQEEMLKDAREYVDEKNEHTKHQVKDAARKSQDAAVRAYEEAKEKANQAYENLKETGEAWKKSMKDKEKQGQESAARAYEEAKERANQAYENVKETGEALKKSMKGITEGVKETGERVKNDLKDTIYDAAQGMREGYEYGYEGHEAPSTVADSKEEEDGSSFTGKVKRGFETMKEKVMGRSDL